MGVRCLLPSSPGLFKGDAVLLDAADRDAAPANRAVEFSKSLFERVPFEAGANFVLDARRGRQHVETFLSNGIENNDTGHEI